jgi:hypothetical protein
MSTLDPKQALFAQFAAVAKTLGHGHRLELLEQRFWPKGPAFRLRTRPSIYNS